MVKNKILITIFVFMATLFTVFGGTISDSSGFLTYDSTRVCLADGSVPFTGNINATGYNITVDKVIASDWTNVTITESQITDLTHTTDTIWNIVTKYFYNNSGSLDINETKLNNTINALDTDTTLSNSTVQTIISNQDIYLRNTGDTATGDYTFDTNTFHIDSVNDFTGFGTTTTNAKVDIVGSGSNPALEVQQSGSGTSLNIVNGGSGNFIVVDTNKFILDNAGNLTLTADIVSNKLSASDWTNVTITESQISDLTHTTDTTLSEAQVEAMIFDNDNTGNLNTTGNVSATYFKGDGSLLTNLPAGGLSDMNWSDPVDANIIPTTDITYNLGSPSFQFKEGHIDEITTGNLMYVGEDIKHDGDIDTILRFSNDEFIFFAGNLVYMRLVESIAGQDYFEINTQENDIDFQVRGDTDTYLIYTEASTDRVGIGTNTPSEKLTVNGNVNISSNITSVENIYFEQDPVNHRIYDNSTCVIIKGDTSTFNIC